MRLHSIVLLSFCLVACGGSAASGPAASTPAAASGSLDTRPLNQLTAADESEVCIQLTQAEGERQEVDCDGRTRRFGGGGPCPENMARDFANPACSVTVAEVVACKQAIARDVCAAGDFGANLPECSGWSSCIQGVLAASAPAEPAR